MRWKATRNSLYVRAIIRLKCSRWNKLFQPNVFINQLFRNISRLIVTAYTDGFFAAVLPLTNGGGKPRIFDDGLDGYYKFVLNCLGTPRSQPGPTSLSGREKSSQGWYPVKREGEELFWSFSRPGAPGKRLSVLSLNRNQSLENSTDLFGLKIVRALARAFLILATLIISSPNFLISCKNNTNLDIDGPFYNFMTVLVSFDDSIYEIDW